MENTYNFSLYGGCVDQVYGLSDYAYAPQITTVGSILSDIVYDSEYYSVPSNFELNPVFSVEEGGATFYYYPYMYYGPMYYVYDVPDVLHNQVLEEPCAPEESWSEELGYGDRYSDLAGFELNPVFSVEEGGATFYYYPYMYYGPMYYVDDVPDVLHNQVLEEPCAPEESWSEELSYGDSYSDLAGDVCPYAAPETPSEAVTSFELYYEEEGEHLNDAPFNSDDDDKEKDGEKKNDDDKKNEDNNGASSLGKKTPMNPDCVKESPAYRKFCSGVEDRRKKIGASSQLQKTFVNRGIVKNPKSYENFCCSVADRIKKTSSSSEGRKPSMNTDSVNESSAYIKFCSEVDDRRKILDSPSVIQKSYVSRGIVNDPSAYQKFCQSVEERIKNLRSIDTSPPCGVKKIIDKEGSKGDEENGLKFMNMIMNSAEYLHVQDNVKNPKHYKDLLYRQSLKNNPRKNKSDLFDILPRIIEEPAILDDVRDDISCGDVAEIEPQKLFSDEITKPEQPKGRFKTFRKWLSKKFCCCFTTKDPP